MSPGTQNLIPIAGRFTPPDLIHEIRELGRGNINSTFLVTTAHSPPRRFVLQQLNLHVFRQPEQVMANMRVVTEHLQARLTSLSPGGGRLWRVPHVIPAEDGRDYWVGQDGGFWRAMDFIDNTRPLAVLEDPQQGREAGFALGMFHRLLSDLPSDALADTLEGFHVTPRYVDRFQQVLAAVVPPDTPDVRYALQFVRQRQARTHVLEKAKAEGRLLLRPIHGDPKCNNILVDVTDGLAVSMVDLDTVKPGLLQYDIGDCLRSGCNPLGEDIRSWDRARFDVEMARAILEGYLSVARPVLTAQDFEYMYDGIRLIAFELGLRFFTDYLEGNVYFRTMYPEQNLLRALVQFRLTLDIEAQERTLRRIILDLK